MAVVFGEDRQGVLARELTKRYEEFSRGSLAEIIAFYDEHQPRGEYVVLVAGNSHPDEEEEEETGTLVEQIDQAISEGLSTNEAIKLVAKKNKLNRQELYKQYHNI